MCLKPKESAKIADKDIVVYKVLLKYSNEIYLSPYRGAQYEIGKLYTANIQYCERLLDKIVECSITSTVIEEGLHSYTSMSTAFLQAFLLINGIVFEAIIPKGATYVLGTNNDIVSTQLKLIEQCH